MDLKIYRNMIKIYRQKINNDETLCMLLVDTYDNAYYQCHKLVKRIDKKQLYLSDNIRKEMEKIEKNYNKNIKNCYIYPAF